MSEIIYSVSELTGLIKEHLELSFPKFKLQGEVSNCKYHSSGHVYFTLKDEEAQIPAIIWRSLAGKLSFDVENGVEVIVEGRLELYPPSGRYQVICQKIAVKGEGALQQRFAELMQKLASEKLFEESGKKPIPRLPATIGLVTSRTGAVIEDIKTVLSRRYPIAHLVLCPVKVQGTGASEEISRAIDYFNHQAKLRPDVLIVGRGGGSLEDLWAFNEETVARAIFNSDIPIISAVGHETDITIADMVADRRAATPSMAAEIAAPDVSDILASIDGTLSYLGRYLQQRLDGAQREINSVLGSVAFNQPVKLIENKQAGIEACLNDMTYSINAKHLNLQHRFNSAFQKLELLSYTNVLERGFALVHKDGTLVKSSQSLAKGDKVTVKFHDGTKPAEIQS